MAKAAVVSIVIPLIGAMAFFLGLMKVAEEAGAMKIIAKLLRPLMVVLFPDVPPNHPAMSAMILNMAANALGLGNAATPFGIKAMQELDTLNPHKGTATDAMCLFLAINTSSVTLLPTGVIAIRETLGSTNAAGILPTTLVATILSTTTAITAAKLYQRFTVVEASGESRLPELPTEELPTEEISRHGDEQTAVLAEDVLVESRPTDEPAERQPEAEPSDDEAYPLWVSALALLSLIALVPVTVVYGSAIGPWIVPLMVVGFTSFGVARGVAVYEVFVQGAKEGWEVAVRIIPFLVAILAAVGMLRGSGAIDLFVEAVGSATMAVGLPAEALPMALLRPLSGSGAYGVMMATLEEHGPDSYIGYVVSTLQGSTETTFYVIAVYFGAVQVQRIRHGMAAALTADLMGVIGAVLACSLYFSLNDLW
ncbi:MAG TPA: spore maturation protein [Deltaproteobacteria bacterium]|nr:spore maturation protein [Deltaproteobacteria bacterium]